MIEKDPEAKETAQASSETAPEISKDAGKNTEAPEAEAKKTPGLSFGLTLALLTGSKLAAAHKQKKDRK